MKMSERELLISYILHHLSRLEDDEHVILNRVRYMKSDAIDCVELMLAKERVTMFREFSSNVMHILKIGEFEIKKMIKRNDLSFLSSGAGCQR